MSETTKPTSTESHSHINPELTDFLGDITLDKALSQIDIPHAVEFKRGNRLPSTITNWEEREKILDRIAKRRNEILQLPSHEDGVNLDRVKDYREMIGAPKKEIRILDAQDYDKVIEMLGQRDSELKRGQYLSAEDVIIVKRLPQEDSSYGTGLLESIIVHEIAHSFSAYPTLWAFRTKERRFLRKKESIVDAHSKARVGFASASGRNTRGLFLEEGYAEYERGQYIVNYLGLKNGFVSQPQSDTAGELFNKYWLPPINGEQGGDTVINHNSEKAGVIAELLIQRDPELLGAIRVARESVDGLRAVAQRIDAIIPGLYTEISSVDIHNDEDCLRLVRFCTKALEQQKKVAA